MVFLLADIPPTGPFQIVLVFSFLIAIVVGAVWFIRGPAKAAEKYTDGLAERFPNTADTALFRRIYQSKSPKSTLVAWLLTTFLSPSISYVYQGKWALAVISFITLQGLFCWWILSIFTMPFEVMGKNKRLADEAYNEVQLARR